MYTQVPVMACQELELWSRMLMQEMTYTLEHMHHGITVIFLAIEQADRPLQAGNYLKDNTESK